MCDGDSSFPQVANLFGADSKEISIVEFNHNNDKMVHTLQFESGLIVLINRLGSQSLPVGLDHVSKKHIDSHHNMERKNGLLTDHDDASRFSSRLAGSDNDRRPGSSTPLLRQEESEHQTCRRQGRDGHLNPLII